MTYAIPLDEPTYRLAAQTINRGRVQGVSPITALHTAGLLLSPDLANRIREDVLLSAAENIRQARFRDLIGDRYLRQSATPSETRQAIVERLEELAALARTGGFR